MKKIVASVGLVAIGASAIQSASAQALGGPDNAKPWSISATLRGFYDDNTATLSDAQAKSLGVKKDSFGFELSPSGALSWSVPQTTVNLGILYSYKYYDTIPALSTAHGDNVFTFSAGLTHSFNEQIQARVSDSFVIGQEPDLLRAGNTFSTFQRVSGSNIRNYGSIGLDAQLTPQFGIGAGYDNGFYDYKDTGVAGVNSRFLSVPGLGPVSAQDIQSSLAGALNRIENRAHLEALWQIQPETKVLVGYQFTDIDYTGNEPIAGTVFYDIFTGNPVGTVNLVQSKDRNSREHTVYVGAEHNFTQAFSGSARVGASYSDYYNDPTTSASYSPYVNLTLKYTYGPESSISGGFSYDRSATDVIGLLPSGGAGQVTTDAESAVVFATINHRIMPQFFGSLLAQFQNSTYNGGAYNNQDEQYYLLGLDFEYRFNQYLSAHAGYNYDRLESNLGRNFDRNRVYIGVTASY